MPGLDGPPPLPPNGGGPNSLSYSSMAPPQEGPPQMGPSAGQGQTGAAATRIAMELDASMKVLAQMVPQLAPWAEQSTAQLREQLGALLNNGDLQTSPEPDENRSFPGGRGLL